MLLEWHEARKVAVSGSAYAVNCRSVLLICTACMQRLGGGPDLPKQMAEMDRELRALQQQVMPGNTSAILPSACTP